MSLIISTTNKPIFISSKKWYTIEDGAVMQLYGYTGAVKPPVRRTGNRESGRKETVISVACGEAALLRMVNPQEGSSASYVYSLRAGSKPYTSLMER